MQRSGEETAALTPQESFEAIHTTMDSARSSMYVAGTTTILLFWAAIAAVGLGSQYAIMTLASEFADRSPVDLRGAMGGSDGAGYGGERDHRTPGRQEDRARRRCPQSWHKSVPLLAGSGGGDVPHPGSGWDVERRRRGQDTKGHHRHIVPCLCPFRNYAPPSISDSGSRVRRSVLHSQPSPGRCCYPGVGGIDVGSGGTGRVVDT